MRVCVAILCTPAAAQTKTIYVEDAVANGDGKTWSSAYSDLQDAIDDANIGDQIWVAEGFYQPSAPGGGTSRSNTFAIPAGVDVYGGFDGTENFLIDRAGLFSTTILNGNLQGNPDEDWGDDCYHVVTIGGSTSVANIALDGFVLERGNANGIASGPTGQGGGIRIENGSNIRLGNLTIRKCHGKQGGGVFATTSNLFGKHLVFRRDGATQLGGGLCLLLNAESYFHNLLFDSNSANSVPGGTGDGGAVYIGSPTGTQEFANVLAYDNWAARGGCAYLGLNGGAAVNSEWIHCTIAYNHSFYVGTPGGEGHGEGFFVEDGTTKHRLRNCILWGNFDSTSNGADYDVELASGASQITADDSDIGTSNGAYSGSGNLSADPLFVSVPDRNLHLSGYPGTSSPCIEAGDEAWVPLDVTDVDDDHDFGEDLPWSFTKGHLRVANDPWVPGSDVDMGYHERFANQAPGQ